jgi:hypothetical protein
MRVLLPLRKLSSNNPSSSENLEELEQAEQQQQQQQHHNQQQTSEAARTAIEQKKRKRARKVPQLEGPLPSAGETSSEDSFLDLSEQNLSSGPCSGVLKTTGLIADLLDSRKRSIIVPRKRPRKTVSAVEDNLPAERLASDQKPAAKPVDRMGLGPPNGKIPPSSWVPERSCVGHSALVSSRTTESSDDPAQYAPRKMPAIRDDADFCLELKQRGLEIREQEGDGNCLFRAVSLQVYGDASMHGQVRKQCMDFMVCIVVLTVSIHLMMYPRKYGCCTDTMAS